MNISFWERKLEALILKQFCCLLLFRLINRLEVHAEGVVHSGVEGDGVVDKTVFASNQTNTIVLPQFLKLPVSSFVSVTSSTSRTSDSGCSLDVPTALTPWDPT